MGKVTGIAWCDHTWNGWIGCQKVSPGCTYCYAEREAFVRRERSHGRELWGPQGERHKTSAEYWFQPVTWNREAWVQHECGWRGNSAAIKAFDGCPQCFGKVGFFPTRQRVFCMSLGDALEDRPELIPWRTDLFNLITITPNLDWLILTKRIELAGDLLPVSWFDGKWPKNVWMGVSVENQQYADFRIPELMKMPAPVRFISAEPLLGPVDITLGREATEVPSWVIVGGESGSKYRPFQAEWARAILDQCRSVTPPIPFFMKQLGGHPDKRDNVEDFPEDLRIREWPA